MNRRLNSLANSRVNHPSVHRSQGDHFSPSSANDALFRSCGADGVPHHRRSGMNSHANSPSGKMTPQLRFQTGAKPASYLHRSPSMSDVHSEKSACRHTTKTKKSMMTMKDFDQYQLAAIQFDIHRPLIITAGPGSGKTRTIVGRVVHMVQKCGIPGHKILALTFSREATQEMQNRLTSLAPDLPQVKTVTVKTFHAFCLRIMHNHVDSLEGSGLRAGFTLCANKDVRKIVRQSIEEWNLSMEREEAVMQFGVANNPQKLRGSKQKIDPKDADKVLKWIQKQKAHGRKPSSFNQQDQQSVYGWLFEDYERQLKKENLIDFSDMINKTIELLGRNHQIADYCSARYQYILVDEFQDLSPIQFEVLRLISHQHGNVTICGDDDQSIYGFRGGSSKLFHTFRELFPNHAELNLEMNYRSSQHIVDSSMAVIIRNPNRSAKRQISVNREGAPLRLVPMTSEVDEVHWIVQEVENMRKQGVPLSEIAVLCRVRRNILQPFEQEFKKRDIPFIKSLRKTLSDRIIVDDIISYLSLIVDPYDNSSFVKIYNKPKRRLGDAVLNYLDAIHREQVHTASNFSYLKAIELAQSSRTFRKAKSGAKINKGQQSALKALYEMTKSMYDFAGNADVEDVITKLLERIDLKSAIEKEKNQQSRARDARRYTALFEKERMKRTNGTLFSRHGAYNIGDDADGDDDDDEEEFERDFEFEKNLEALKQEARYFCRKWILEEELGVDARANMERSDWITLPSVSSNANTNRRILSEFVGYMRTNDTFQLSDMCTSENSKTPDAVTVSTIHQSKGLEWKNVFLVRCNERILPISIGFSESDPRESSDNDDVPGIVSGNLEEERRLMFVGMTRAKESLIISYIVDNDRAIPSRFIEDIPQESVQLVRRGSNGGGGGGGDVDCSKSRSHYSSNLHSHNRLSGSSLVSSVAPQISVNLKRSISQHCSSSGTTGPGDRNMSLVRDKGKHILNSMQSIVRPTSQRALSISVTNPKGSNATSPIRSTTPRLNSLAQKQSSNPFSNRSVTHIAGHGLNNLNCGRSQDHPGGGTVWRSGHDTTLEELKLFREIESHLSASPRLSSTKPSSETGTSTLTSIRTQSSDGDESDSKGIRSDPLQARSKRRKTFVTHY